MGSSYRQFSATKIYIAFFLAGKAQRCKFTSRFSSLGKTTRILPDSYQNPTRFLPGSSCQQSSATKIYIAFFVAEKKKNYQIPTRILPESYQGPLTDSFQQQKFTSHFSSLERPSDVNLRRVFRR